MRHASCRSLSMCLPWIRLHLDAQPAMTLIVAVECLQTFAPASHLAPHSNMNHWCIGARCCCAQHLHAPPLSTCMLGAYSRMLPGSELSLCSSPTAICMLRVLMCFMKLSYYTLSQKAVPARRLHPKW